MESISNIMLPSQKKIIPPPMVFSPSVFSDTFTSSVSLDSQVHETYEEAVEALKKEVRTGLMNAKDKIADKMILIDTVERLGLSYHIEQEIEEQLKQIFEFGLNFEEENHDLFTTALQFRLLRQHGYNVSCGVFERFYNHKGNKFEETLGSDIHGLLSLYEATSIRFHNEDVLEEGLAFTLGCFKSVEGQQDCPLGEKVMRALAQYSLQRDVPRAEARRYISLYGKEEPKNALLLRVAISDFNALQILHKKELHDLTRWWNSLDILSKLPYSRGRIVECYFWAFALYFEPQYSFGRVAVAKTIQMIALLNDTYDNHGGTLEELEIFTEALQHWDINKADHLPDYMKFFYQVLLDLFEEFDHEVSGQGRSYAVTYLKEAMIQLARGYHAEAKWFIGRNMPTFDEYIRNGVITSSYYVILSACFLGMESASQEVFEWIMSGPKILQASGIVARIVNDVATYNRESREGQVLTPLDCYMKQHGTTIEQTRQKFIEISENAWKDLNKEWVLTTSVPRNILLRVLNITRITETTYKHGLDGFTTPEDALVKEDMVALFVNPINC